MARCSATSTDEQAVLQYSLGPRRSRNQEIRLADMQGEEDVSKNGLSRGTSTMSRYSLGAAATNTPVWRRENAAAGIAASSSAHQACCNSSRCCGSISAASAAEMPKN